MKYIALIPSYEPDDKLIGIVKELHKSNFELSERRKEEIQHGN